MTRWDGLADLTTGNGDDDDVLRRLGAATGESWADRRAVAPGVLAEPMNCTTPPDTSITVSVGVAPDP
jgi:hypothetical protein